jgi:hypothetical protein
MTRAELLAIGTCLAVCGPAAAEHVVTTYGAKADDDTPDTAAVQAAIDAAAREGGGVVRVPKGRFISGGLQLRDNIRLVLDKDAVLQGSADCRDYGGKARWDDALIKGESLKNIRIEGPGTIDGADCKNPKGEEGFRGPHGILLTGCSDIAIKDLALERTGNYAILCRGCTGAELRNVSFRGGHDGIHAQACAKFDIRDCDFRTGDDCLAGCDDADFEVTGCAINSSCNGFRLGCLNLLVKDCRFWGPGEYVHRVSLQKGGPGRTNMLSAFVHFAPKDRSPKLPSDQWLIQDCTIDNVDFVYGYDIEKGLWQTGQPAKRLRFRGVKATRVAQPIRARGDAERQLELTLEDVSIELREDRTDQEILNLTRFGSLVLKNVTLQNSGKQPVLRAKEGKTVWLDRVTCVPANAAPYALEQVDETKTGPAPGEAPAPR